MNILKTTVAAMAFAAFPLAAAAQDSDMPADDTMHSGHEMQADATTTDSETMAEAGPVTDAELGSFVSAAIGLAEIGNDATTTDEQKQQSMATLIATSDLTADRFNYIGAQLETNEELKARFETEIASQSQQLAS